MKAPRTTAPIVLSLALLLSCAGGQKRDSIVLRPEKTPGGIETVRVENPSWPGNVWELRLPGHLMIYGHVDTNIRPSVTRGDDGSITIRGQKSSHGSLEYTFVLEPVGDAVDIRATVTNAGSRPWDFRSSASCCLSFERAPGFRDSTNHRTSALFDGQPTVLPSAEHSASAVFSLWDDVAPLPGRNGRPVVGGSLIVRSAPDGKRHVALAWENALSVGYDRDLVCSNPRFGVVDPGETVSIEGRVYFFTGTVAALRDTFESDFPGLGYGSPLEPALSVEYGPLRFSATVEGQGVRLTVSADSSADGGPVAIHRRRAGASDLERGARPATAAGRVIHSLRVGAGEARTVVDEDVRYGDAFVYWISRDDRASPPVTVRVRDPLVWWGRQRVDEEIDAIIARYPDRVRVRTCGRTVSGWPLRSLSAGNPDRSIAVVGGIHAAESGPEIVLPVFERLLANDEKLLEKVGVAVLPLVNGDGRQRVADGYPIYTRKNARGVDLNRNFDARWDATTFLYGKSTANPSSPTYRGDRPASEPETRAVVDFVDAVRPSVLLSIHGPGSQLLAPAEPLDGRLLDRVRAAARVFHDAYAAGVEDTTLVDGLHLRKKMVGSLPLWASEKDAIVSFDVECDRTPECRALSAGRVPHNSLDILRKRNYEAVRALLGFLARGTR